MSVILGETTRYIEVVFIDRIEDIERNSVEYKKTPRRFENDHRGRAEANKYWHEHMDKHFKMTFTSVDTSVETNIGPELVGMIVRGVEE